MTENVGLSDAEVDVLKVLWDIGPAPVRTINRELAARGRNWAYTTASTLLLRLATKGCVASDSGAVPHVFQATVTREERLARRLRDAADELCRGETAPLVLALVPLEVGVIRVPGRSKPSIEMPSRVRGRNKAKALVPVVLSNWEK